MSDPKTRARELAKNWYSTQEDVNHGTDEACERGYLKGYAEGSAGNGMTTDALAIATLREHPTWSLEPNRDGRGWNVVDREVSGNEIAISNDPAHAIRQALVAWEDDERAKETDAEG